MSIGGAATVVFGIAMLLGAPAYLAMGWLRVKLLLVMLLIAYHYQCYRYVRAFAERRNTRSSKWYRGFNEFPSMLLIGVVILAIVKPF
jgi:putative membrane protein